MKQPILNFTLRSLTTDDGLEFYAIIDRNRLRLRDYFPVAATTITSLATSFEFIDKKVRQAKKESITLLCWRMIMCGYRACFL